MTNKICFGTTKVLIFSFKKIMEKEKYHRLLFQLQIYMRKQRIK